ncbi:MAG: alpha-amylase [Actinobacteria bacterium]|nr:alpha-amylase [Actinomycetota bacterium]MBW3646423.1 alpha-amylase [Actinomycetota bacterium]
MVQPWWRDAVVYEIYVRSFADSDGDGVGDLEGVRSHLDHLVDLGVDALWLTPFYPSPMHDHGYDVADYVDIEPVFGDLAAFDRLLSDAHERDLRVIVDLVPNHTSNEHPWFQAALAGGPERQQYVFRPGRDGGPPNNWTSVFGGPAWTLDKDSGEYYLHLFDATQPDLEWRSPAVHEKFRTILRTWLDRGVDGFRIDVAHALYKHPDLADEPAAPVGSMMAADRPAVWDQPEVVGVYEDWRRITDSYTGDRMMVGEVFLLDARKAARYVGPSRLQQAFNFSVAKADWGAQALREVVDRGLALFDPPTWVLSNHDLPRHTTRFGGGETGRRRAVAATALLLALPGSTYLYQGEELGLEDGDVPAEARQDPIALRSGLPGRDGCRTPMPWVAQDVGHGFTTGRPWLPFGADASERAVDVQRRDETAMLATYRQLLVARRTLRPHLGNAVTWLDPAPDVLALRREGGLVCVLNTSERPVEVPCSGDVLVATQAGACVGDGSLTVPPVSTVWLREDPTHA